VNGKERETFPGTGRKTGEKGGDASIISGVVREKGGVCPVNSPGDIFNLENPEGSARGLRGKTNS